MSAAVRRVVMRTLPLLLCGVGLGLSGCGLLRPDAHLKEAGPAAVQPAVAPPTLQVRELLEPGAELRPTAKASALAGQRVRLVGFVAELELGLPGTLYLVPHPVRCDEAGGGTADLPPESVLVTLPTAAASITPHVPGLVEVVGTFSVGNRADAAGSAANFRLQMEESTSVGLAASAVRRDEDG